MSNEIVPSAIIGPDVILGDDNYIGAFTVIVGNTVIGDGNWIGPQVVIGTPGQSPTLGPLRFASHDAPRPLHIGDKNTICEFTSIHSPLSIETRLGNCTYLHTHARVPHDCTIGDGAVLSSNVALGGHSSVGVEAKLGPGAITHQRIVVGDLAIVGMGSVVTKDIPPGSLAYGSPARVVGANQVGLKRRGLDEKAVAHIESFFAYGSTEDLVPDFLADSWDQYRLRILDLQQRD